MTEAEWLICDDTLPLFRHLRWVGTAAQRRERLFAASCVRRAWRLLADERSRVAVQAAERYADRLASHSELAAVARHARAVVEIRTPAMAARKNTPGYWAGWAAHCAAGPTAALARGDCFAATHAVANAVAHALVADRLAATPYRRRTVARARTQAAEAFLVERAAQAHLLRQVTGNPFRPASVDAACLTAAALVLAQAPYDERILPSGELEPARLAILADALEEAGGIEPTIVNHLRGPGPHVHGFWLLDALLGKG
jgi:hypothetical protein